MPRFAANHRESCWIANDTYTGSRCIISFFEQAYGSNAWCLRLTCYGRTNFAE
ncbi:hypothetical protein X566_14180 [Afipia sp. P52-10]|nr:hypothetical protein X566_14180 [Afipia sp. P52-10]